MIVAAGVLECGGWVVGVWRPRAWWSAGFVWWCGGLGLCVEVVCVWPRASVEGRGGVVVFAGGGGLVGVVVFAGGGELGCVGVCG